MTIRGARKIARIDTNRIENGDTVITHCNSSATMGAIKEAHCRSKEFKVIVTESCLWRQEIITVMDFAEAGMDVTMIIDSAVRYVINDTDKVFVGADTITSHGVVINKIGTSQLALATHKTETQFYVCEETYKFSPMTMSGDLVEIEEKKTAEVVTPGEIPDSVKILNHVFDSMPTQYIDTIITEVGIIQPIAVYDIMVRQLGDVVFYKE